MNDAGIMRRFAPARSARRLARVAAGLALYLCLTAQVPVPVFVVPMSPAILLGPVLLLMGSVLAVGALSTSGDDEKSIERMEAQADWNGLYQLANRRIAERSRVISPGADAAAPAAPKPSGPTTDPRWYYVRAHALHRQGKCDAAIDEYAMARLASGGRLPAADLNRALCQMDRKQWDAAADTLATLAAAEPNMWEAPYNLAIVRVEQGRLDEARRAAAALRPLRPELAASLESGQIARLAERAESAARAVSPEAASATARGPSSTDELAFPQTGSDLSVATAPARLGTAQLSIGDRTLHLPPGPWALASVERFGVPSRAQFRVPPFPFDTPAIAGTAIQLREGLLVAVVAFGANPRTADGVVTWDVDTCRARDAIHVERFARLVDRPECLSVRVVSANGREVSAPLAPALKLALENGARLAGRYYEIHYSRYAVARFGAVTVLVPEQDLPGDFLAVQWARAMADAVRPLAEGRAARANLPAPGS